MIHYENLSCFCYTNDKLVKAPIRGICVEFFGLGKAQMVNEDSPRALSLAEKGIIYIQPYLNPWAWMNRQAVETTDRLITVLAEHYALENVGVCSTGKSMGGLSSLVFAYYSTHRILSCVSNCPVCDLPYHLTERVDLPRTLYSAFYGAEDFDAALRAHSPLHLAEGMPDIPYHIFHCEADLSVNIEKHSNRFVAAMQREHTVTYDTVPDAGHCRLSPEMWERYDRYILEAFGL